jgi:2-oxoisovalerate ferredoxin oxidoreductase beta subunit
VLYDCSVVAALPALRPGVRAIGVPFTSIAAGLGKVIVKNIVALGALQEATQLFPRETFLTAVRQALSDKCALIPLNEEAFARGMQQAAQAGKGNA